jgi:hypothetical protein
MRRERFLGLAVAQKRTATECDFLLLPEGPIGWLMEVLALIMSDSICAVLGMEAG